MDWERVQRLIDIQERLASDLDEMVTVVMTDLHEEPYTLDEVHIVTQNKSKEPRFLSCFSTRAKSLDLPRDY